MFPPQIIEKFSEIDGHSAYYAFKIMMINKFEKNYYFSTIKESKLRVIDELLGLKPKDQHHRYFYIHVVIDFEQEKRSITWESLGQPNLSLCRNPKLKFFTIFNRVVNLANVPSIKIYHERSNSFCFAGSNYKFKSKTNMLKEGVPIISSKIRSVWSDTENCAIASNILRTRTSFNSYQELIRDILTRKINNFLANFDTMNLEPIELYDIFFDYYNIEESYILYKL